MAPDQRVERILDSVCFKVGPGQILAHEIQYALHVAAKVIKCLFKNASFTIENIEAYIMQKYYPSDNVTASLKTIANEIAQLEDVMAVLNAIDSVNLDKEEQNGEKHLLATLDPVSGQTTI